MTTEPYKVDRSKWKPGPWDAETEDRVEWRHLGYPCLLVRNSMGAWCGYVGLSPGHPGIENSEGLSVHGGLTYQSKCQVVGPICHVPQPGEADDVTWLGFDTCHYQDLVPSSYSLRYDKFPDTFGNTYRTKAWTMEETQCLTKQLKEMEVT